VTNNAFAEAGIYYLIPLMMTNHAGSSPMKWKRIADEERIVVSVKNILAFALMIPTFYLFGWWVYWGFPHGWSGAGPAGISGVDNSIALRRERPVHGANISDQASGVFFGAFAMFAATTASIMSGVVIERIQTVGFVILAGNCSSVVAAAWGWHAQMAGWSRNVDFGAAGFCPRSRVSFA
jgi:ammonia channel protein AmtB